MDNSSPTPTVNEEAKKKGPSQSVYVLILSVLIMILAAVFFTQDMNKIKSFISEAGIWGVIISIFLYALLGVTLIPSEPLTLFIGALFGPWLATLIAGTGNTLSAMVEYYLGTHIGSATNFQEKKDKLPFGLGKMKVESPVFLIGARMIPGYGPKIVSMMAGMYRVPILRYLWTTAIPIFCGAAVFAFGGFGLGVLTKIK
ncbi:MAG: TVP38/TMEM64 family protein [Anaerolineaceae bacterium]|nr:TVP38/TMEM64 family protein [Anaerolineaceae bacterium]